MNFWLTPGKLARGLLHDLVPREQPDHGLVGDGSSRATLNGKVSTNEPMQDFVILQGSGAVDNLSVPNPAGGAHLKIHVDFNVGEADGNRVSRGRSYFTTAFG